MPPLNIFGLVFGAVLALDGVAGWGLAKVVPGAPGASNRTYVRIAEAVIGAFFILLAVVVR